MNFESIKNLVNSMAGMKYFPSEPAARLALVELMGELTDDEEKVRWLAKRMRTLYSEWPGEREMRACFCSKFRPKDGIEVHSTVYLDGIPSERETTRQLEAPKLPALPPGHVATADDPMDREIQKLAAAKAMKPAKVDDRFSKALREIETAPRDRKELPGPTPQKITQADVYNL